MMKYTLLFGCVLLASLRMRAQNTNPWPVTGPVGIGVTTPGAPLEVRGPVLTSGISDISEMARFSATTGSTNTSQLRFLCRRFDNSNDWTTASTRIQSYTDITSQGYLEFNPPGSKYGLGFGIGNGSNGVLEVMRLDNNGFVGIGTSSPGASLHVAGHVVASTITGPGQMSGFVQLWADNAVIWKTGNQSAGLRFGSASDLNAGSWSEKMRITDGGNVLIGKYFPTNPIYLLDVNGAARANRIVVNTTGADYVFDSSYRLRPLSVVEKYIAQYHHLPEVASADSMKKAGLDVGENQTTLLKKIEELTLYILQQQQQIQAQNKAMDDLRAEMAEMKKKLKN